MKYQLGAQLIKAPTHSGDERAPKMLRCKHGGQDDSFSMNGFLTMRQGKVDKVNKIAERVANIINEKVKRKLSLGAKILQAGGVERIFKNHFSVREGEKILKVSQCYLSTTAGPIAGLLFITIDKVAFCSEKSIRLPSPTGDLIRIHYKVSIPIGRIVKVNEGHHVKRTSQKYLQVVTVDNFDFWLMGFLSYRKTYNYLQQVIFQSR